MKIGLWKGTILLSVEDELIRRSIESPCVFVFAEVRSSHGNAMRDFVEEMGSSMRSYGFHVLCRMKKTTKAIIHTMPTAM